MKLEDAIIKVGLIQKVEMAKLYKPANTCYDNPSTGIEVENESVVYVIRDCALMAKLYLPIEIFCRLKDPITNLKGKMKATEIKEFAKEVSEGANVYKRVLYTMIFDYKAPVEQIPKKIKQQGDIYGDYSELIARCVPTDRQKTYEFAEVVTVLEGLLV